MVRWNAAQPQYALPDVPSCGSRRLAPPPLPELFAESATAPADLPSSASDRLLLRRQWAGSRQAKDHTKCRRERYAVPSLTHPRLRSHSANIARPAQLRALARRGPPPHTVSDALSPCYRFAASRLAAALRRLRPLGFGAAAFTRFASEGWWSQAESNRRPLECHSSALPTELWPLQGSDVSTRSSDEAICSLSLLLITDS